MSRSKRESTKTTKKFADRLGDLVSEKKNQGLSQREIAEGIGVSSGSLSEWCSDYVTASIDNLVQVANYFCVSTDYLLGLTNTKSKDENIQSLTSLTRLTEAAAIALANEDTPSIIALLDAFLELPKNMKEKLGDCFFAYMHIKDIQPVIEKNLLENPGKSINLDVKINGRQLPIVPVQDALDYSRFELTRAFLQAADNAYERGL